MFLIILLVRAASSALLVPMQYELVLVPRLPTESVVLCKMYFTRLNSMEDLLNLKVVGRVRLCITLLKYAHTFASTFAPYINTGRYLLHN